MLLFGVYDKAVKKFSNYFFAESDEMAVRSFVMSYGKDEKFSSLFGDAFTLIKLASIDDDTGAVTNLENLPVMSMVDAVRMYKGVVNDEVSNAIQ